MDVRRQHRGRAGGPGGAHLEFRSAFEMLLPGGLRSNGFVQSLVHVQVADLQSVLGSTGARPKAPFAYTNTWGSVMALSLVFVGAWLAGKRGRSRTRGDLVAVLVLMAAVPPILYSLNRGLWGSLALGAFGLAVLAASKGRPALLGGFLATGALVAAVVLATPLGSLVTDRLDNQHSNSRRGELLTLTTESVTQGSPVLGFGSTRDVQGSFASITGASTPDCPACGVPPLGTQGQLWTVLFSQGWPGLVFFGSFVVLALVRSARCRTVNETVCTFVGAFFLLQLPIYDTLGLPMVILMLAIGLVAREQRGQEGRGLPRALTTGSRLVAELRRGLPVLLACTTLGAVLGLTFALLAPAPAHVSKIFMAITPAPVYLDAEVDPEDDAELARQTETKEITVDTEAALLMSEATLEAAASVVATSPSKLREGLGHRGAQLERPGAAPDVAGGRTGRGPRARDHRVLLPGPPRLPRPASRGPRGHAARAAAHPGGHARIRLRDPGRPAERHQRPGPRPWAGGRGGPPDPTGPRAPRVRGAHDVRHRARAAGRGRAPHPGPAPAPEAPVNARPDRTHPRPTCPRSTSWSPRATVPSCSPGPWPRSRPRTTPGPSAPGWSSTSVPSTRRSSATTYGDRSPPWATPGPPGWRVPATAACSPARAPLVGFCDDDDEWLPAKITAQVRQLRVSGAPTSVTGIVVVYGDTETPRIAGADELTLANLVRHRVMAAHPSTVVVRREALLGGIGLVDEEIPGSHGEDYDWIIRAARHGSFAVVEQALVRVQWGQSMFSQRWPTIVSATDYWLAKHPEFHTDRHALGRLQGQRAFALAAMRSPLARSAILDTLRTRPRERRAWLAAAVSMRVVSAERLMDLAHRHGRGI